MPTLREVLTELSTHHPGLSLVPFTTGIQDDPPDGAYVGVSAGDDAQRQVVSSDLADLNVAGDGSDTDVSWYQDGYVYLTDYRLQRRIGRYGYQPAADAAAATDQVSSEERVGVLTFTRGMGAVIAAGTEGGVYRPFPPMEDADRKTSLRSWINRALLSMRFRDRLSLTGVSGSRRYSLAAYPWIYDESDLIAVYDRELTENQDGDPLYGEHYLRFDGGDVYLITGSTIADGAAFSVDVYRRRKTWIAVTGTATATATAGAITGIAVTRGGTYTTAPTVTITGAGTGATATATLTNGTVTGITVVTPGTGYATATTTVTLSAGELAASTVGLVNPDDVCTGPVEAIAAVAYALICDDMSHRDGQGTDSEWALRRASVESIVAPYLRAGSGRQRRPTTVSSALIRRSGTRSASATRWS